MTDSGLLAEILSETRGVREDVGEVKAEVAELRLEVRTTTASDADCLARTSNAATEARDGIKRLWAEGINPLAERVDKLEGIHSEETGAVRVKRSIGKWIAGIAASLVVAGLLGAAGWALRGCA